MSYKNVIAIDPGVTTGFVYCRVSDNGEWPNMVYYPFQAVDDVDDLWRRLEAFAPDHIIIEDFLFRKGNVGANYFPIQLIGIARFYEIRRNTVQSAGPHCTLHMQPPWAQGNKQFWSDKKLKSKGYWVKGQPHAISATKHLLYWLTFKAGSQLKAKEPYVLMDDWKL